MRIDRGTGPVLALTPTGLDAAVVRKPVQPVAARPVPATTVAVVISTIATTITIIIGATTATTDPHRR